MPTIPQPLFYVYILARPNGKPFYVGKGKGRRVYHHEDEARRRCKCHKCNVIRKIWKQGGEVQRHTMLTTNNEVEAFAYEIELIALYGRENLTNQTDGGEGASGYLQSVETRAKRSQRIKLRHANDPEYRQKLSEAQKRMGISAERRQKMIDGVRATWLSLDTKMRRSAQMRAHFQDPATRQARSEALTGMKRKPFSEEARRNMSKPYGGRDMAKEICRLYATNEFTMRMLAEQFKVSAQTISNIVNGRVY